MESPGNPDAGPASENRVGPLSASQDDGGSTCEEAQHSINSMTSSSTFPSTTSSEIALPSCLPSSAFVAASSSPLPYTTSRCLHLNVMDIAAYSFPIDDRIQEEVHAGEHPLQGNQHPLYVTYHHPSSDDIPIGRLNDIELDQTPIKEHEQPLACPIRTHTCKENHISLSNVLTERHIKVQNTLKEARERINQLVLPKEEDKQVGAHIFERLMLRIENRQFLHNLAVSLMSFYKRYIALGILWPMQTAASVAIIVTLVSQAEKVNRTFKTDYAQSLLLTAVSMIAPLSIPFLVQLEDWKPATSEHVVLVKLFSLRLVNVCTLYYRLYMALAQAVHVKSGNEVLSCTSDKGCPDGFACCNTQGEKEWVFLSGACVHARMHGKCSCKTAFAFDVDEYICECGLRSCLWMDTDNRYEGKSASCVLVSPHKKDRRRVAGSSQDVEEVLSIGKHPEGLGRVPPNGTHSNSPPMC